MRIPTLQAFQNALDGVRNATREVNLTQKQIASNRRVLSPADDPVAASRILKLDSEGAQRDQFVKNINAIENSLGLSDAALAQGIELLTRVKELAIQAGNGANTIGDRRLIAVEIRTRLDELVAVANTRNASGEYVFAGAAGSQPPFDANDDFAYRGDQQQRSVAISASARLPMSDSGHAVFVAVDSATVNAVARPHPGNDSLAAARVQIGDIVDPDALQSLYPDGMVVTFEPLDAVAPPAANFSIRRASDGRVVDGLRNVVYNGAADIQAGGVALRLSGSPQPGDRFIVETTQTQSVFTTLDRLASALESIGDASGDPAVLTARIGLALDNMNGAIDNFLVARSDIGARLATADSTRELHSDVELVSKGVLAELRDLDFAEAISRLSAQSLVLEAAQRSFSKTAGLSLFRLL